MTDRRAFLSTLGLGLLAAPARARAQAKKSARIGWVGAWYSPSAAASLFDAFREGLRELGYVQGRNFAIDVRWLEGSTRDEAAGIAAELVRSKVDVLVAQGPAIYGVKAEAKCVPIVFGFSGDPVEARLVASLARPGGNLTGMTLAALELAGKRLELLKEAARGVSRVAVLVNPQHPGEDEEFRESQIAAQRLGLALQYAPVRTIADFSAAFQAIARDRAEALVAFPGLLIMRQRNAIAEFATRRRIPTISGWEDFVVDGNLMTYGPNLQDAWRRLATYVDKILKGARPSDLPVERPTRFELIVNLKTARALGLTLPQSILVRADRVIQ